MIKEYFTQRFISGTHSSKTVYGIILVTAGLLGIQAHEHEPYVIAVRILMVGMAIVLAELYADFVGERIRKHKELNRYELREVFGNSAIVASVAAYPALIFVLSGLGLWSVEHAFEISYILSIFCLVVFGYLSAMAAGKSQRSSLGRAFAGAMIGVLVIFIKEAIGH